MNLVRRYPFLTYAAFSLLFFFVISRLWAAGDGYDDGGLGSTAFQLDIVWDIIAFPFSIPREALVGTPGHPYIALAIGTSVCVMAEFGLSTWRSQKRGESRA